MDKVALGTQRGWAVATDRPGFLCLGREKEARGRSGTGLASSPSTPPPSVASQAQSSHVGTLLPSEGLTSGKTVGLGGGTPGSSADPATPGSQDLGFLGALSGTPVLPVKWEGDPNDGGCLSQAKVHLDWTVRGGGAGEELALQPHKTGMWKQRPALRELEKSLVFCPQSVWRSPHWSCIGVLSRLLPKPQTNVF